MPVRGHWNVAINLLKSGYKSKPLDSNFNHRLQRKQHTREEELEVNASSCICLVLIAAT